MGSIFLPECRKRDNGGLATSRSGLVSGRREEGSGRRPNDRQRRPLHRPSQRPAYGIMRGGTGGKPEAMEIRMSQSAYTTRCRLLLVTASASGLSLAEDNLAAGRGRLPDARQRTRMANGDALSRKEAPLLPTLAYPVRANSCREGWRLARLAFSDCRRMAASLTLCDCVSRQAACRSPRRPG